MLRTRQIVSLVSSNRLALGFLILLMTMVYGCKSTYNFTTKDAPYQLGDAEIHIKQLMNRDSGMVFVNLHEDENTSVKAARKYLKTHPGKMYVLKHSGKRRIYFNLNGHAYDFDPNRMFTEKGVAQSLSGSGSNRREAEKAVVEFGRYVFNQLKIHELDKIIALHNNSENAYSLLWYLPNGRYGGEAAAIHQNGDMDHDDFFFTTDSLMFEDLRSKNWNVVLQDNRKVTDDGSLSVYLRSTEVSYVNVEAQDGHKKLQHRMYLVLDSIYHQRAVE